MHRLEHFYYGQLIHHSKPTGEARILAQSKGITDEHLQLFLRQGLLPYDPQVAEGSWGVLRGNKRISFLLVRTQKGNYGQVTHHVIALPSDLLREIAGQVRRLESLIQNNIPTYEMLGDTLAPITFDAKQERTTEQQVDDLLNLMTFTGNNTRKIEPLLAAIVQNKTLAIYNAPEDNSTRIQFIQGLLTLLPSSTRFAVTFATFNNASSAVTPQIVFANSSIDDAVEYDWQGKSVSGLSLQDDYSRFIIGQLRLDAELSLEQAELLTPVAGWRFRSGDNLRDALAYASNRSKLDKAILNHLPAPVGEVSKILSEDPTLSEDLRSAYAEHLITLSIALGDLSLCDPVAVTIQTNPNLEKNILKRLQEVVKDGNGGMVFTMLQSWLQNPLSPQTPEWMTLLRQSALAQAESLAKDGDIEGIIAYLYGVQDVNQNNSLSPILRKIVERLLPFSSHDSAIASSIFLIALIYFDINTLQKLLRVRDFTQNLPRPIKRFMASLSRTAEDTQPSVILSASQAFGEAHQKKVLIKLVQIAQEANAYALIDTGTLASLVEFASSPEGINHAAMLISIYRAIENRLETLEEPANRYLLQIPLAIGRYDLVAQGMIAQSRDYYGGERQYEYIEMAQTLFAKTKMSSQQAKRALENIAKHGIKGIPFIASSCGTLEATQWSADLAHVANENSTWFITHPHRLEVIHPEAIITLIHFYLVRQDTAQLKRTVHLLPTCIIYKPEKVGLNALNRAYQLMTMHDNPEIDVAFEMIRQYIREASPKPSMRALQFFSKKMTSSQSRRLEFAHHFSRFLGRLDLETFAISVTTTLELLKNNHESFIPEARKPSRTQVTGFMGDLTSRLTLENRHQLATDLQKLSQGLFSLGKQQATESGNKFASALIKGQEEPRSALDVLRVIGGHLLRGRITPLKLTPNLIPNPFSEQEVNDVIIHVGVATDLISAMTQGIEQMKKAQWRTEEILDELESMINSLTKSDRAFLKALGQELQLLAEVVQQIYETSDASVMEANSRLGKQLDQQAVQPNNVLELYRFIYRYLDRA